jgi:phosphate starvation-inducible PhoH-like protein
MEETIVLESREEAMTVYGSRDRHLRMIRDAFGVQIVARDSIIKIIGEKSAVTRAAAVFRGLLLVARERGRVAARDVEDLIWQAEDGALRATESSGAHRTSAAHAEEAPSRAAHAHSSWRSAPTRAHHVEPRSEGQRAYMEAMRSYDLVFCVGPGGTGKTYLAVAAAIEALKAHQVKKIVLARPAVEAGEKLGFLPGDMQAKVDPYLRPLYDALQDILGLAQMRKCAENDLIEVVPLAYMRGRTLDYAFTVLDEAQNCTILQMKMFLTRMGPHSRSVVTGDVTQVDLPPGEVSGLIHAEQILRGVRGMTFIHLDKGDIVRHKLVRDIVDAYEGAAARKA